MPAAELVLIFGALLAGPRQEEAPREERLFPFVLSEGEGASEATDLSAWTRPAAEGKPLPRVEAGPDGRLRAGGRRVRFLGVNLSFAGNFPARQDADRVAARLARFGVNVVRFHHLDTAHWPQGIWAPGPGAPRALAPEALERLDFFVACLARRGIYANLNLLVGRPFGAPDGLPREIETLAPKERHAAGFFHAPLLELQKDYARALLSRRNPHTGFTYAEDPAVAFVEIHNENGLLHAWKEGALARLPAFLEEDLRRQWNAWLRGRHGSGDALARAWGVRDEPLGAEMLGGSWSVERHEGARAETAPLGGGGLRVRVTHPGTQGWHVQLARGGLKVEAGRPYTLRFRARAEPAGAVRVSLARARPPWGGLGWEFDARLGSEWREFRFCGIPSEGDDAARLLVTGLGTRVGAVELADVSLRPGGRVGLEPGERPEDGTVRPLAEHPPAGCPREAVRDWIRFLRETEGRYWRSMARFLREDLGVRALLLGTIVGCSTPALMAELDVVDAHAYWKHPEFPGRPWDPERWRVENESMVNARGGTLPALAARRVLGKPFSVTEYNHPAPNTYGTEGFLLLASYAALQDWDAIYVYSYSHRNDAWDEGRISGFFDVAGHAGKMVTLLPAAAMFRRGDVRPAEGWVAVPFGEERELEVLERTAAWDVAAGHHAGLPPEAALVHRVGLALRPGDLPGGARAWAPPAEARYVSDTGEVVWDARRPGRGVVSVAALRSRALVGFAGGRTWELGDWGVEVGSTLQDGWCAITATELSSPGAAASRWLVTATGFIENTGMGWKDAARSTVGRDWGRAPTRAEGIPARLRVPRPAGRVRAWALDGRGARKEELPVAPADAGRAWIELGPRRQTLWYEVVLE
jgi:hypothetical protein